MKKIIAITSLALIAVMLAAALCACGGNKVDKTIVGTWKSSYGTMTLNSDGKGSAHYDVITYFGVKDLSFSFSTNDRRFEMTVTANGESETEKGTYVVENDTLTIVWDFGYTEVYTRA